MRFFASFLVVSAAALAGVAAQADVKTGVDAWVRGDFGAAVAEWRPLADRGDADAQYNLGQAYYMGRGVPADLRIAQTWYEKAAQQGHPQAAANLGLILFQNGEKQRAIPWLKMGAEADDPRAEYVLGTALFNGDVAGKDWPRAYALMSRAAAQGFPPAAKNLQSMDEYVPEGQRRQGLALAEQIERSSNQGGRPVRVPGRPGPRTVLSPDNAITSTMPAGPPAIVTQSRRVPPVQTAEQAVNVHRGAPPSVAVHHNAPPPAPEPTAAPAAGGRWRIQLGAFSSPAGAHRAWDGVKGRLGGLQPIYGAAGAMTRLQAGPLPSRAAAERACAAAGSACFPVAP